MKCGVCNKNINSKQSILKCTQCDSEFHIKCVDTDSCPVCCEIECLENINK